MQKESFPHTPFKEKPNSQLAIGINKFKPIANCKLVDKLLDTYTELIDPSYKKWFASRFYSISPEMVERAASEARVDGKNPKKLFVFLIKKYS